MTELVTVALEKGLDVDTADAQFTTESDGKIYYFCGGITITKN